MNKYVWANYCTNNLQVSKAIMLALYIFKFIIFSFFIAVRMYYFDFKIYCPFKGIKHNTLRENKRGLNVIVSIREILFLKLYAASSYFELGKNPTISSCQYSLSPSFFFSLSLSLSLSLRCSGHIACKISTRMHKKCVVIC